MQDENKDDVLKEFIQYYRITYIGAFEYDKSAYISGRYEIKFLNAHDRILNNTPRTTNALEGWNSSIKYAVRVHRPNLINLIIALQKEQKIYEARMSEAIKQRKENEPNQKNFV